MKKRNFILGLILCCTQIQAYDTTPKGQKYYDEIDRVGTMEEKVALLVKACEAGHSEACNGVGYGYQRGEYTLQKDLSLAMKYYRKACDSHHSMGCRNVGDLYAFGKGVEQDSVKAMEYYKRGCDLTDKDNVGACYQLAVGYDKGYGVTKNEPKAMSYFQKACDKIDVDKEAGGNACYNLGIQYNYGDVVAVDRVKARQYAQKSCNAGNENGCKLLNLIP